MYSSTKFHSSPMHVVSRPSCAEDLLDESYSFPTTLSVQGNQVSTMESFHPSMQKLLWLYRLSEAQVKSFYEFQIYAFPKLRPDLRSLTCLVFSFFFPSSCLLNFMWFDIALLLTHNVSWPAHAHALPLPASCATIILTLFFLFRSAYNSRINFHIMCGPLIHMHLTQSSGP